MSIRILVTGGTLDKIYHEIDGQLTFQRSQVEDMVQRGRCTSAVEVESLLMKDSLHIDDEDRMKIVKRCQSCNESRILITHGTDTMVNTAQLLAENVRNKTIVLTGAMIPYAIRNSDALFNLGYALAASQFHDEGVYIAMNGQTFPAGHACKDLTKGIFISTRESC